MTTEQVKTNLEEAKQALETLDRELPKYQSDATQTALEVSQLKGARAERKVLSKAMLEAQAARELLDQIELEITGTQAKIKALEIEVTKQKLLEDATALATDAFNAKLEWEKNARVIHQALESVSDEAKKCGENLATLQQARVGLLNLVNDLSRSDKNLVLAELRNAGHDLTPLLTRWPMTPVSGLDMV